MTRRSGSPTNDLVQASPMRSQRRLGVKTYLASESVQKRGDGLHELTSWKLDPHFALILKRTNRSPEFRMT